MGTIGSILKNHSLTVWLPVYAGMLALPLTGRSNALRIMVATAIAVILWKIARGPFVRRRIIQFKDKLSHLASFRVTATALLLSRAGLAALAIALVLIPALFNDYYLDIMTLTCMYVVLALGLNIVVGQAGLLNLGYVAFYAVGAYTYAILSTSYGLSFWPGLVVGASAASLFALLVGSPILRLRGDYFAIVTLGLGEITRIVLNNWDRVTGGPNGIPRIGRPVLAGYVLTTTADFYYLILVIVVISIFVTYRLMYSRIGRAWKAVREDETAAEAMGINTFRLKLLAFVIGSFWAGLTGVFFAAKMAFVSPESFTFFESVLILCMVVLGGMGSIPGIVLGACLLIALPEAFREFQDYRMLAFGVALVLMMIFRPQGLLGAQRNGARSSSDN